MAGLPRAARTARRLWPVALALYRRWDSLPPEQKERYRRMARENAQRSREAAVRSAQVARERLRRGRR
jgi:TRAP-type C4-dicarboxylate transport system substrate-binding protein